MFRNFSRFQVILQRFAQPVLRRNHQRNCNVWMMGAKARIRFVHFYIRVLFNVLIDLNIIQPNY